MKEFTSREYGNEVHETHKEVLEWEQRKNDMRRSHQRDMNHFANLEKTVEHIVKKHEQHKKNLPRLTIFQRMQVFVAKLKAKRKG